MRQKLSQAARAALNDIIDECDDDPMQLMIAYDCEGICASCGIVGQRAEPDAEGYICEDCGEPSVMGIENAIIYFN